MAALFGRDETDHLHVFIEPKRKNLNWKKRSKKKKKDSPRHTNCGYGTPPLYSS
jgi:hypothetical protein